MEEIRNYPCLYDKTKMSCKESDVNRNAWSKVAEKLDFIQNGICKCRYKKLFVHLQWQRIKELSMFFCRGNRHFEACIILYKINWASIAIRCSNRSGEIRKYLKIRDEEYLLY